MTRFYHIAGGNIYCDACVAKWKADTADGKLVGDEAFTPDQLDGEAETPAQCDSCLDQSDDYDEVLDW